MRNFVHLLAICVLFAMVTGCQTFGREKDPEPELKPVPQDINLAAKDKNIPYNLRYEPPKPLPLDHPARVASQQQVAMVTPSRPTVAAPLEKGLSGKYLLRSVLVVGDSFAVGIGMSLSGLLKHYDNVSLYEQGKTSSGLNSKKFYNWGEKLKEYIESTHPDTLVVMISGNDAHNGSGSESWARSYEEKMRNFLSIAASYKIPVYLVGLPPMGKDDYSERAKVANRASKSACRQSSDCDYVDAWPLFADDSGAFTRQKCIDGASKTLRGKDGVHFTMTGYKLLGNEILEHLDKRFELVRNSGSKHQGQFKTKTQKHAKTASTP